MIRGILKRTTSVGLALCLGLAFLPLACGGTKNPWAGGEPVDQPGEGPQVPKETVAEMTECLSKAGSRLTDTVYAMKFDVEVTESGHAGRVRFRDSFPSEPALEACIADALRGMTSPIPASMLVPKDKAEAVSPASRGLIGQGWEEVLIGGSVTLGPAFLVMAGVTATVVVVVLAGEGVVEAVKRKRKIDKICDALAEECLS